MDGNSAEIEETLSNFEKVFEELNKLIISGEK